MKLSGIMIGSEDPKGLTEYYTRLFGEPAWSEGGFAGGRSAADGSQSVSTIRSRVATRNPGV